MDKEWDVKKELAARIKGDKEAAWKRVQAYYKAHDELDKLADYTGLEGLTDFYDSDYGITLNDFSYGPPDMSKTPLVMATRTAQNDGDTTITQEFAFTKSTTDTFSFGFTEGLKVGVSAKVSAGLPVLGQGEVTVSGEVTFSANQNWTKSETKLWTQKVSVPVPAHSTVKVTGFITQAKINAKWTGFARATKGKVLTWVVKKDKTFTEFPIPLTVLLTAEQRAFPIGGTYVGVEGVNAYTHVEKVD